MSLLENAEATVLRVEREEVHAFLIQQHNEDYARVSRDTIVAAIVYLEAIEERIAILDDRSLAQSNQRALESDTQLITEALRQEGRALEDRQLALRLSRVSEESSDARSDSSSSSRSPHCAPVAASAPSISTNATRTNASGATKRKRFVPQPPVNIRSSSIEVEGNPHGSKRAKFSGTEPGEPDSHIQRECVACGDDGLEEAFVSVLCKHSFCKTCLAQYTESALQPGATFPPQCCGLPVTFGMVQKHLSPELATRYGEKQRQIFSNCSLLCARRGCCVEILENKITGMKGHCLACNGNTCKACRKAWHGDKPCSIDPEREAILQLAKKKGCQSCYRCNNMVELNLGCFHMRCICQAEFCYVCGQKWKNCGCLLFDENRLLTRAERAVDRRAALNAPHGNEDDVRPREEQIQDMRTRLQQNYCDHNQWTYIPCARREPGICQFCGYQGRAYIYECAHCSLRACNYCHLEDDESDDDSGDDSDDYSDDDSGDDSDDYSDDYFDGEEEIEDGYEDGYENDDEW